MAEENGDVMSSPDDIIENERISSLILGDDGYPGHILERQSIQAV